MPRTVSRLSDLELTGIRLAALANILIEPRLSRQEIVLSQAPGDFPLSPQTVVMT